MKTSLKRKPFALIGALSILALVIVTALGIGGGNSASGAESNLPPAVAQVTKGTLTQTETVGGILSFGDPVGLITHAESGVITWMPSPGQVIKLGETVFEIDNHPVTLLHGDIPPYRDLKEGTKGADVLQLEQNLTELGYPDLAIDDTFDTKTTVAVKTWQESLGLQLTGIVTINDIVVTPNDIRVALPGLAAGSLLGFDRNQTVLTYSGVTQKVSVPLDVNKQHLVAVGNTATITLPNGVQVEGAIASISKVAVDIEDKQVLPMVVTIENQGAVSGFDAAPVTLDIVSGQHENVLMVPITALVALQGGGYGVQVVENDTVAYVPVETGMFSNGMVEISGDGIVEGVTVGVAQ